MFGRGDGDDGKTQAVALVERGSRATGNHEAAHNCNLKLIELIGSTALKSQIKSVLGKHHGL